jgi:hypothetical protein
VIFYNPSFYCPEKPEKIDHSEPKTIFSPILIAGPAPKDEAMME